MEETKKQVCECKNCGNEAEMVVTCTLVDDVDASKTPPAKDTSGKAPRKMRKKQSITCTHCGNEAEMWLDEQ